VAIPAVLLLLGFLLAAVSAGLTQIRVEEAARSAARTIARGDSAAAVAQEVRRIAGQEADHSVESAPGTVTVRVSAAVAGPVAAAAGLRAAASATLSVEGPP
jgi:Flp pilus assembly protein TadG